MCALCLAWRKSQLRCTMCEKPKAERRAGTEVCGCRGPTLARCLGRLRGSRERSRQRVPALGGARFCACWQSAPGLYLTFPGVTPKQERCEGRRFARDE